MCWNKAASLHPWAASAAHRLLCYYMKHEKGLRFTAESTINALAVEVNGTQTAAVRENRAICWTFLLSAAANKESAANGESAANEEALANEEAAANEESLANGEAAANKEALANGEAAANEGSASNGEAGEPVRLSVLKTWDVKLSSSKSEPFTH